MSRRTVNYSKYITVFAITTLVFIGGILIGNYFSSQKLAQINTLGENLKADTMAMELQYELISENACEQINSTPLAEELYEMASKLDYMENRLGEDNEEVKELKKHYSLLEIRHWLFMKKTVKECGQNQSLIIFFYENEDDCKTCKEQGFILTWLRRNYDNVYIYSFDYALENVAVDTLKNMYGIEGTPAVIIDKQTFNRFITQNDLQDMMQEKEYL